MSLPIRTTLDDIDAVCRYLATKSTGATLTESKAVLDGKRLDGRKLSALKVWRLIEENDGKLKITELGRRTLKDDSRSDALCEVIRTVPPYRGVIERVANRHEDSMTATEVAAHWHDHFKSEASDSEKTLNDQAVCFFQVAHGAGLGTLKIGRRGKQTRFEFNVEAAGNFVDGTILTTKESDPFTESSTDSDDHEAETDDHGEHTEVVSSEFQEEVTDATNGNRVFITHGKNLTILEHVKETVAVADFEPVVAMEQETAAKPVPKKVMADMQNCSAAVIHVSAERILKDEEDKEVRLINENVLIEIGAAMALYGDNFVLLVEEGISLPSNLQGLYECRYEGDVLSGPATLKLLKAFNNFREQLS